MSVTTPDSLEELRRLYGRIRKGESEIQLTKRIQTVLKKMLDNPNETATKSISEIANENNINISSVTRMAQKLGFDGFPDLKDLFRKNLTQRKNYYSVHIRKFLKKGHNAQNESASLLQRVIQDEWSNVMMLADGFEHQQFANIIDLIIKTRRVAVIGLRSSYTLAYYFAFYLKMIRDHVTLIGKAGHTLAEDLSVLQQDDLLIAISVNPYTQDTVAACRVSKQHNINIVAITDSVSSPLANESDLYLITRTEGDYFFSPISAAIICIETLLSALVKELGDIAIRRVAHTEHLLEKLEIEI